MKTLLDWYQDARGTAAEAAGARWYQDAGAECARLAAEYGTTRETAAGIVAALSPRIPWKRNLIEAENALAGRPVVALGRSRDKATRILEGERPEIVLATGPKTLAFYRALVGDLSAVILDVWMLRAIGHTRDSIKPAQYVLLAEQVRDAARKVAIEPAVFQAIVWCAIRGRGD